MVLVSVCITAYNIEEYISECLDSILSQDVDFDYEIVIGEDCSTDGTRDILKIYEQKYPGIFRVIYNSDNLGMMPNFIHTIESCRGEIVAVMDGDDKWTDPLKLQKQVHFLLTNKDYSLCFHDAYICDSSLVPQTKYSERYPERYKSYLTNELNIKDIVHWRGILGATSSIVFRKSFDKFPEWVRTLYGLEPMLFILLKDYGRYKYIPELMSAYRVHSKSTDRSFSKISKSKRDIGEYYVYYHHFYPRFSRYYLKKIVWNRTYLVYKYFLSTKIVRSFANLPNLFVESCKYLLTFLPFRSV